MQQIGGELIRQPDQLTRSVCPKVHGKRRKTCIEELAAFQRRPSIPRQLHAFGKHLLVPPSCCSWLTEGVQRIWSTRYDNLVPTQNDILQVCCATVLLQGTREFVRRDYTLMQPRYQSNLKTAMEAMYTQTFLSFSVLNFDGDVLVHDHLYSIRTITVALTFSVSLFRLNGTL